MKRGAKVGGAPSRYDDGVRVLEFLRSVRPGASTELIAGHLNWQVTRVRKALLALQDEGRAKKYRPEGVQRDWWAEVTL